MKRFRIYVLIALSGLILVGLQICIEENKEDDSNLSKINFFTNDSTVDRIIIFGEDEKGHLNIKIEGYSGMTDAAEDFFNHLKGKIICDCCGTKSKSQ